MFHQKIKQCFLVNNVTKGVTTKGSAYYNVTLQDASGTIEGNEYFNSGKLFISVMAVSSVYLNSTYSEEFVFEFLLSNNLVNQERNSF